MTSATEQLIALAEQLSPTGEIGDGMVAQFHDLARRARLERQGPKFMRPGSGGVAQPESRFCPHDQVALQPGGFEYKCGRCGATVAAITVREGAPRQLVSDPLPLDGL